MNINQKIDNIESKAKQLAKQRDNLLLEKADLVDENKQLKIELAEKVKRIGELRNKLSKTQRVLTNKEVAEPVGSEGLRKQLDQYIQEIDKCIEWLENS